MLPWFLRSHDRSAYYESMPIETCRLLCWATGIFQQDCSSVAASGYIFTVAHLETALATRDSGAPNVETDVSRNNG